LSCKVRPPGWPTPEPENAKVTPPIGGNSGPTIANNDLVSNDSNRDFRSVFGRDDGPLCELDEPLKRSSIERIKDRRWCLLDDMQGFRFRLVTVNLLRGDWLNVRRG